METTKTKRILLVFSDENTLHLLERNVLSHGPYYVQGAKSAAEALKVQLGLRPDLLILGDNLPDGNHFELAEKLLKRQPTLPIILFTTNRAQTLPRHAAQLSLVDWLSPPVKPEEILAAVERGLERSRHWQDWLKLESSRYTGPLMQQVDELQALAKIGRLITGELQLDGILPHVVDAAVMLSGADSASILLIDEETGELYMRAARNFEQDFVRTFRIPVEDSFAGKVIQTGEPIFINNDQPQKIKTAYLVYSLIYVPLIIGDKIVGVLGVDNQATNRPFEQRHLQLLLTLAEYAAVALNNSELYLQVERERRRLQNILTQVNDGVLIVDPDEKVILINHAIRKPLALAPETGLLVGQSLAEICQSEVLLAAIRGEHEGPYAPEFKGADNHFYNVQITDVTDVGKVAVLHDITYLKELDRVKTEFIGMVSHDLRSPLTSILGYVDLIPRVGEVNERQQSFINNATNSVHTITELIDDLLNLSKLEMGMEEDFERISYSMIVQQVFDELKLRAGKREQQLTLHMPKESLDVFGNPTQLRQVVDNLLSNAIKYTPVGGLVTLSVIAEGNQVITQVADTGVGIPINEQTRVFDKFYRATNRPDDAQGTGLGLAITKSIVEKHDGRIWLTSSDQGSIFTVVFPVMVD